MQLAAPGIAEMILPQSLRVCAAEHRSGGDSLCTSGFHRVMKLMQSRLRELMQIANQNDGNTRPPDRTEIALAELLC